MDPSYRSSPEQTGTCTLSDCTLYYERRGAGNSSKIVLIMGAFSTLRHYDELADKLASEGHDVLTYDHRGIGKSSSKRKSDDQTSKMLANDCIQLIAHVFGDVPIHIYGASMGGCVAQYVAITLQEKGLLLSLYLAVTSRGSFLRFTMPQIMWKFCIQTFLVKKDPQAMVRTLVPRCFDKDFLKTVDEDGRTIEDRWIERWTKEYSEWFSFSDLEATASQCGVFATHYVSDNELRCLRSCQVTVHIAEKDDLIPARKQRELGVLLNADLIEFKGGHLLDQREKQRFYTGLMSHLAKANNRGRTT